MIPLSERKTTEIKFRTSPTWKARVQSAAADADESLSEFIEKAVDDRMWVEQKQRDEYIESIASTGAGKARRGWSFPTATERDQELKDADLLGPIVSAEVFDAFVASQSRVVGVSEEQIAYSDAQNALSPATPSISADDPRVVSARGEAGDLVRNQATGEVFLVATPPKDVPTSDAESRGSKPWMFEARSGE